jgi:hypothetical protein
VKLGLKKNSCILNIILVMLVVSISLIYNYSGYNQLLNVFRNNSRELPVYSVDTPEKKIAISFDAAWGAVINTLKTLWNICIN